VYSELVWRLEQPKNFCSYQIPYSPHRENGDENGNNNMVAGLHFKTTPLSFPAEIDADFPRDPLANHGEQRHTLKRFGSVTSFIR
jgi:hypothetical protein